MKKPLAIIIIAGLALAANHALGSLFSFGSSKTVNESRVLTLDMAELSALKAVVGAGQLVIQGDDNASEMKVFAELQYKENNKDNIILFLQQRFHAFHITICIRFCRNVHNNSLATFRTQFRAMLKSNLVVQNHLEFYYQRCNINFIKKNKYHVNSSNFV